MASILHQAWRFIWSASLSLDPAVQTGAEAANALQGLIDQFFVLEYGDTHFWYEVVRGGLCETKRNNNISKSAWVCFWEL